jgi:small subunit ribosomal protein S16
MVKIDTDRVIHWLGKGAQPSDTVRSILKKEGIYLRLHLIRWGKTEEEIEKAVAEFKAAKNDKSVSASDQRKAALKQEEDKVKKDNAAKAVEAEKKAKEAAEAEKKAAEEAAAAETASETEAPAEEEAKAEEAPAVEAEAATETEAPAEEEVKAEEAPAKEETKAEAKTEAPAEEEVKAEEAPAADDSEDKKEA